MRQRRRRFGWKRTSAFLRPKNKRMKLKAQKIAFCNCSYCRTKVPHRFLIVTAIVLIGVIVAVLPRLLP